MKLTGPPRGVLFEKLQKVNPRKTPEVFFFLALPNNKCRYLLFFLNAAETERKNTLETIMDNSKKMIF